MSYHRRRRQAALCGLAAVEFEAVTTTPAPNLSPRPAADPDVDLMSPEYREIIALFATSGAAMRCKEVCQHLGLGTEPRHVEGMRSKLKRLVERGILAEPSSGLFKVDGRKQGW
ncbi:hypothetical protein [Streptomyces sp. NPDC005784]|uniref:hypothetical protein n=1 Tax=Streptomyces sp. NPDC005784 TaxID=3364731 RepID=UPI00369D6F8F